MTKSPPEQIAELAGKALWLASYPKSGNTWFRSFLSALFTGRIDINHMNTNGIFSGRNVVDKVLDIDSRLLDEKEVKNRLPSAFRFQIGHAQRLQFVKAHDAYTLNSKGEPIFPADISYKAVYLVRNPLDVVGSFANHNNSTIDHAIKMMNKQNGYLARQKNGFNINNQFPQLMFDWSGHVKSWLDQDEIEVIVVRFEDSKKDAFGSFSKTLKQLGLNIEDQHIKAAIEMTSFEKLKREEEEKGFREKSASSPSFFRKGKSGGWKNELTRTQALTIIEFHSETMQRLGYLKESLEQLEQIK